MPIVRRATYDLLEMAPWVDIMVNPVNCIGVMGKGLALAFKEYCPESYDAYRAACIAGNLQMGNLHVFYNTKDKTTILNVPTKRHWSDSSNLEDVELSVITLARYLKNVPMYTVALPMLGTGNGKLDHDNVYNLFMKHLDALPNVIHVCMRPDNAGTIPKHLVIGGSRKYKDYLRVDLGITDGMIKFGLGYSDFEALVSGGADGVDAIACGRSKNDIDPNIAACHKVRGIICPADWERFGQAAGYIRNKTMLEIGTHFILFIGKVSVGTRNMKDLVERHNRKVMDGIEGQWKIDVGDKPMEDADISAYNDMLPPTKQFKHLYVHDISEVSQ